MRLWICIDADGEPSVDGTESWCAWAKAHGPDCGPMRLISDNADITIRNIIHDFDETTYNIGSRAAETLINRVLGALDHAVVDEKTPCQHSGHNDRFPVVDTNPQGFVCEKCGVFYYAALDGETP